ncbi:MAG: M23 family metallopeptidase [bacterium]
MQKRRSDKISILIVPEDNAEPYSLRIKTRVVKLLYVVTFILVAHIITGAVFYWKYVSLASRNHRLIAFNNQLQEDNKRVIALADQFYTLEREYQKVRSLLGVENRGQTLENLDESPDAAGLFDNIMPAVRMENASRPNLFERKGRYLLTPKKSKLHDYAENMPTLLPVKGILTQDFQKNAWLGPKRHTGIDIVAKKGTVTRAAGAGTIIFANWTYDLGNLVIINHGNGVFSYYGHNQRILKSEKGFVKKGEPIALLGTSGKSSGPHLHFEIWKDGEPMDPKEYILAFNERITTN